MREYTLINKCPISNTRDKITYFNLGKMPLVNNLCDTEYDSLNCKRYPLKLNYFRFSGLSALSHAIDGKILFSNYLFKSEINVPYVEHCKNMLDMIQQFVDLDNGDLMVDIGGNDGTLLSTFKQATTKKLEYLNIDPSENLAELSESKGITVLTQFFDKDTPKLVKNKAKVVTTTNVFQHLKDTIGFANGVHDLLEDDGLWILEFPYWINDLETNQFDQIYHEHMYYYSIQPLIILMSNCDFKIINVDKHKIHGGTVRMIMAKRESNHTSNNTISKFYLDELKYDISYYANWALQINCHLDKCKMLLGDLKRSKKIAIFGAAAKGCIFLNALKITNKDVMYIIDDTDIKQGKYMPGTGLEIVSRDSVNLDDIDYMIILPHNFSEHIIESFKDTYKGRFVIFLPTIKII